MNSEQMISFVNTIVFYETQRYLRDIEVLILEGAWNGQTYADIAEHHNYSSQYLTQDIGPKFWKLLSKIFKEEIKKSNFRAGLERNFKKFSSNHSYSLNYPKNVENDKTFILLPRKSLEMTLPVTLKSMSKYDWGEAPDISRCFGRDQALKSLDLVLNGSLDSSIDQRCRLISLLGLGGIGKTVVSCQLAQRLSKQFDCVIWRSLRHRPEAHTTVRDWIQQLCFNVGPVQSKTFAQDLLSVLKYLREHRCLLILDDFDAVLEPGSTNGTYRPQFEEYGLLLRRFADTEHQSCLMLISRIRPQGLIVREGPHSPVQSFLLPGFQAPDTREILKLKGCYGFDHNILEYLTAYYGGNPFVLRCFAATVQELTDGNVSDFLLYFSPGEFYLSEVEALLHQQLFHLIPFEKQLMAHFASCSGSMTLSRLINAQHCDVPKQALMATLQSLRRRSLIEHKGQTLFVHPYILDYIREHFMAELERGYSQAPQSLSTYTIPEAS